MTPREQSVAILKQVAAKHGVPAQDLHKGAKWPEACEARWEAFYRLRTERRMTLKQIGELLGYNYATVHYGISRHAEIAGIADMADRAVYAADKRAKARQRYHERAAAEREWRAYSTEQATERAG